MATYYNEFDPYAAQWLRNLIAAGHIAPGEVDERSICDVDSADLAGFTQCHFFAGIGVWSLALRRAGWSDDRPVWTGSCPCQPFSAAGKRDGFSDERHLWPHLFRLIAQRRPPVVFGEQVASRDGLEWLDLVQADLEGADYASAAVDICAAGVGAPHIRQRLYWVADASGIEREREPHFKPAGICGTDVQQTERRDGFGDIRAVSGGMADADGSSQFRNSGSSGERGAAQDQRRGSDEQVDRGLSFSSLADADDARLEGRFAVRQRADERAAGPGGVVGGVANTVSQRESQKPSVYGVLHQPESAGVPNQPDGPSPTNGHWADVDWLFCRDDKWRPVEPGTFPLAHGATARVGRLRAYGNAIVPQVAQAFVEAFMECRP